MTNYDPHYTPHCVNCHKVISWRFLLCRSCENQYGNVRSEMPEWLQFLIREEEKIRNRIRFDRIKNGNEEYLEELMPDSFYYNVDIEAMIETKMDFAGYVTAASDGFDGYTFPDSDWYAVYDFSF